MKPHQLDFGGRVRDAVLTMIEGHLTKHRQKIAEAHEGDQALTVNLGCKFYPAKKDGSIDIEVGINFIAERIKETAAATVDEHQHELPFGEAA